MTVTAKRTALGSVVLADDATPGTVRVGAAELPAIAAQLTAFAEHDRLRARRPDRCERCLQPLNEDPPLLRLSLPDRRLVVHWTCGTAEERAAHRPSTTPPGRYASEVLAQRVAEAPLRRLRTAVSAEQTRLTSLGYGPPYDDGLTAVAALLDRLLQDLPTDPEVTP